MALSHNAICRDWNILITSPVSLRHLTGSFSLIPRSFHCACLFYLSNDEKDCNTGRGGWSTDPPSTGSLLWKSHSRLYPPGSRLWPAPAASSSTVTRWSSKLSGELRSTHFERRSDKSYSASVKQRFRRIDCCGAQPSLFQDRLWTRKIVHSLTLGYYC